MVFTFLFNFAVRIHFLRINHKSLGYEAIFLYSCHLVGIIGYGVAGLGLGHSQARIPLGVGRHGVESGLAA